MRKINQSKKISKSNKNLIWLAILITFLWTSKFLEAQTTTKDSIQETLQINKKNELETWIQKYIKENDQTFFKRTLERLKEDNYIWENINAFMDATIGNIPNDEEKIIWKLIAINMLFPDSNKTTDYIKTTPALEMEIDNFYTVYRNWRTDYRKYLLDREKVDSQKSKKTRKFLKKDPSDVQKPKYEFEKTKTKDFFNLARETVEKNFPIEKDIMEICIAYIEEDPYMKTNIEKLLSETIWELSEKDQWIATLQAISIITKWITNNWLTINTTFAERNHIKINQKSEDKISEFLTYFTSRWIKYINFSKKTRRF